VSDGELWFFNGIIWVQAAMLAFAAYWLFDCVRVMRQQTKVVEDAAKVAIRQQEVMCFLHGIITALQTGVIEPRNLLPVDLRNLPVEMRLRIWHALIDVAVELHKQTEKAND
jgi:hypothetical protein